MKKAYVKPQLYFENFELSANIAVQCGYPIHYAAVSCKDGLGGLGGYADVIFIDTNSCSATPDEFGLCYHNPTDTTKLFNS